jgi:CHAD domain-containing protein
MGKSKQRDAPMQIEGNTLLWIAARALLEERGDDFSRRRDRVLKTFDPEDIHDLRVSSRRLREGLALFAPCYPPGNVARIVRKIRQVTRLLGEMRNTDEALLFFTALASELADPCRPDLERVLRSFQKNRNKEIKRLKTGLRETAPGALRDQYRRVINSPALFTPQASGIDLFAPLAHFAKDSIALRLAAVTNLVPEARQAEAVEAQHLLRIAVKHFRYRLEILHFLLGAGFPELLGTLKGYQETLGKMHDLDVFAGIVRAAGFPSGTEAAALAAIAAKRGKLFAEFSGMLAITPFDGIGEQVRHSL